jgi:Transposase DDE domain
MHAPAVAWRSANDQGILPEPSGQPQVRRRVSNAELPSRPRWSFQRLLPLERQHLAVQVLAGVLVLGMLGRLKKRLGRLKLIFADSADGRNNLPEYVKDAFGWLLQTALRPAKVKGFVVLPKRWIVERTFGWLGRYRRHSEDYKRNTASSEAMIYITMIHIMLRRVARAQM